MRLLTFRKRLMEVYLEGSRLTAAGLGFPQYSNDDVVIPALVKLGYDYADAVNYTVAACWEFIIPNVAADIVNIDALSFPKVVDRAFRAAAGMEPASDVQTASDVTELQTGGSEFDTEPASGTPALSDGVTEAPEVSSIAGVTRPVPDALFASGASKPAAFRDPMEELWSLVCREMRREIDSMTEKLSSVWSVPAPFMDLLFGGRDIAKGGKYNYFGFHGTGIACAADSLAAIEKYLYTEHRRTLREYLAAVDDDFKEDTELLYLLRHEAPKLGQDRGLPEKWAARLLHEFSAQLEGRVNCRGGRYRAGTGTAMYYLWHADELGASPDGRRKGEPFGTNYSASLFAELEGPVSVVNSFTAPDLGGTMNGGPLTLEFQQKMFDGPDGVEKVAQLVRYFVYRKGHQLQLNAVSRETLLDAQAHPEKYPHLIVRVWGWSAYFVELDKCYQDQVLMRQEYTL